LSNSVSSVFFVLGIFKIESQKLFFVLGIFEIES
jgi:hypothetical protein